jgi:RNA polymerase sigma factor (sigma-70 family)
MDSIAFWLNAAGAKAISPQLTTVLASQLSKVEPGSKRHTKIINRICEGNLKLLYTATKSYSDSRGFLWGTSFSLDLLQAGYFGLRVAAEQYDLTRGTKFSTCAVPWIRQRVGRYLISKEPLIYVPENVAREVYHRRHSGGKPSGSKNAPKSEEIYNSAKEVMEHTLSLDARYNEKNCLVDILEAPEKSNNSEHFEKTVQKIKSIMVEANLEPKVQRFLLEYSRIGNLTTAASKTGVNVSRCSKIYHKAIEKCREVV